MRQLTKEPCVECGDKFKDELGVEQVFGVVVGRDTNPVSKGGKSVRVFFSCDVGHTWSKVFQSGDEMPPSANSEIDERGVLNAQPSGEPKRCPIVDCRRHVTHGDRCVEHRDCNIVAPNAMHCDACALRVLELSRAGGERCPHGELVLECEACFVASDLAYDAMRERS